jgi:DNA helicase-2/ATP-dependent DNA helicase PcrA
MEERIDLAMPYGTTQMWISTFHAFCDRILRNESLSIGLDPNYKLMSEAETIQFFKDHLFDFSLSYYRPLGNPTKFISGMLQHFNRLRDEDISPEKYKDWVKKQTDETYQELANAYRKYEELKVKESVIDYADLIANTLKLFRTRKKILEGYQKQFKYILIDEFQDTNIAQNELAILLAGRSQNVTVVGDDDQAIYRWRGAAISNIIQFRKRFKKVKVVVLTKNYRSTQEILNHSYDLIQHNNPDRLEIVEKINKRLECVRRKNGAMIQVVFAERVEDEAEAVAKEINAQCQKVNAQYKDFAILVRANAHADPFVRALSRAGIPYQFLGPGQLFKQPEVKDIIAYLKVLSDIHDSVAMYRILTMDVCKIRPRDVAEIVSYAKQHAISIFAACEELQGKISAIQPIVSMIHKHLGLIKKESAGQIAYFFLQDSGLLKGFTNAATVKDQRKVENIAAFFDKLKTYEVDHDDASVFRVVDWLDLSMDLGESPLATNSDWGDVDAVNILTIHSAKGLEFPIVFLVNLVSARFPTNERHEQIPIPDELVKEILPVGDYHVEEERRLFYVGMTRARDLVYLTGAKFYGDGKREKKLSPFIQECIGEKSFESIKQTKEEKQLFLIEWEKQEEQKKTEITKPPSYIWYTHIESFRRCPLQYKYRYVIKIPIPTSAVLGFGDIMHKTMQEFYQQVMKGECPKKEMLLSLYEQKWKSNGFMSKAYESNMKKHGEDLLKEYYAKGYDPKEKTVAVELGFKIKIAEEVTLGGKIDRVDRKGDGKLEIIDYKTGVAPKKRDVSEDFQLSLYALAATDKGVFGEKPENLIVSFYFFEGQERMSATRGKEQLEKVKEEIVTTATDIGTSDFRPTPGMYCAFCEFRLICEAWRT